MKKILYFALLAVELFVGTLFMISLWEHSLYIPIVIAVVLLLALLTWHIVLLINATDAVTKRNIMARIALVMLVPSAVFFVTCVVVAIMLVVAFSGYF